MSDATDTPTDAPADTTTATTTDTTTGADEAPAELPGDGLREGIVAALRADLGEHLLDTHLVPQTDLWVRVSPEAWQLSAQALKAQGFDYFCFLSAIDWMPSPYGKGEDDPDADPQEPDTEIRQGYAGGDSRFQVFARLTDIRRHVGVTIKADVPDTLTMPTWIRSFAGANWHERETHEMFGIGFDGHPDLRNLYLPGEFEGHPLRKDFPLLARMIKPWPGIVDVEPMPAAAEDLADEPVPPSDDTAAGDAVEAATAPSTDAEAPIEAADESTSATTETVPRADGEPVSASADAAGDEVEPTADVAEAAEAVEAAHATADADDPAEPAGGEAAESASDTGEPVDDVEPAPADASETARAETADAARASDDDAALADLGPGTTTESTDADDDAPTPGRATDEHPDGLTGGDDEEHES